mmetsp:Transcript_77929/g.215416  ORF Transcript_77929/g.215416 Transcript_77929/m.215416 type:complete len:269 (+) Transcript_77929:63-869(+)|eukprot:CAMPEP_0179091088 /NCGR_PEP_ID=MMETSP0796-20121207/41592_1 /TAXON_ID=73915 /ORGANISM="Pyrodinium bahamense, Strain pbaha01" /LENGTH=268 /DNA_ID=CAMNT_0020788673 /DNA_START=61 /DNA_END=867 /DNA_ORIENTATION=+
MASFSSGVMISKSEAERRRGDELRMRKQGLDPNRDDKNWGGAVISRRQHRQTRVEKEDEKEREEAEALPLDLKDVIGKRPENRLKWLQRALMLAGKKRVQLASIYDIVQHKKFVDGISHGVGRQMRSLLLANLHLFSQKQQRALQSETSKFSAFAGDRLAGKDLGSDTRADLGGAAEGRRRSSDRSCSRSSSGGREDPGGRGDPRKQGGRIDVRSVEGSRPEAAGAVGRSRSRSRSAASDRQPARLIGLKMKLQPWQPHVLRAAAAPP